MLQEMKAGEGEIGTYSREVIFWIFERARRARNVINVQEITLSGRWEQITAGAMIEIFFRLDRILNSSCMSSDIQEALNIASFRNLLKAENIFVMKREVGKYIREIADIEISHETLIQLLKDIKPVGKLETIGNNIMEEAKQYLQRNTVLEPDRIASDFDGMLNVIA